MKTNNIKHLLINNPKVVFKKPGYLFYVPNILLRTLYNRMLPDISQVYFVETLVAEYLDDKNIGLLENNYSFNEINSFEGFEPILNKRILESPEISTTYTLEIQNRFLANHKAFAIYQEEEPLGYIFVQVNETNVAQVNYKIKLTKDIFTFIDLYIFKKYRGKNLHEFLYTYTIYQMRLEGYTKFYCWLMKHNQVSIKAHIKIGIHKITKIITRKRLLGFSKLTIKSYNGSLTSLVNSD